MKLFGRTAGYYLFWAGFVYFWVSVYLAFTQTGHSEYASLGLVLALSVPLLCPPVARHFNMEPIMFNWFRTYKKSEGSIAEDMNKVMNDMNNVVKFPEAVPYVAPPAEPEKPVTTYYRLGITNNSRVSFQMGYSEITMNADGINNMIKQLECFRDQIVEYETDNEETE